jgi:hypothetical protein
VKGIGNYLEGFPKHKGSLVLHRMLLTDLVNNMTQEALAMDTLKKHKVSMKISPRCGL